MPNWCHNTLIVSGPADRLKLFVEHVKLDDQPLSFEKIIPYPPGIFRGNLSLDDRANNPLNWYDFNCQNWGTKWDAVFNNEPLVAFGTDTADLNHNRNDLALETHTPTEPTAVYQFDTAWSPPMPIVDAIAEACPDMDVKLIWGEPGSDVGGQTLYRRGELIHSIEGDVSEYLPEEMMWF